MYCQRRLEEINFSLWEGLTWTQVEEQYPEEFTAWYENRRYQDTNGRILNLLDRLLPCAAWWKRKLEAVSVSLLIHSAGYPRGYYVAHGLSEQHAF